MGVYSFNVSQSPAGVCPPKLSREIKQALGLAKKPRIEYAGRNYPGTDNLESGVFSVQCRDLSAPEQATLLATIQAHAVCEPFDSPDKDNFGFDLDDLDDLFLSSMPGQVVYVRDLARINGNAGKGSLVYRTRNGWRRVSNDDVVTP